MKHHNACLSAARILLVVAPCLLGTARATDMYVQPTGVGIGTSSPERMLHLTGPNALFRMDRSANTAAFMMVRTTTDGLPLKSFVLGTNATNVNEGEFVINDLGAAVGGPGLRRMTITNTGAVSFTGSVVAAGFSSSSTAKLKRDVVTIVNPVETVKALRGVRFNWRNTGLPSIGLIAEEVNGVVPEVVEKDVQTRQPTAVNYSALVGVLIEAIKKQQATIEQQSAALDKLSRRIDAMEAAN